MLNFINPIYLKLFNTELLEIRIFQGYSIEIVGCMYFTTHNYHLILINTIYLEDIFIKIIIETF